MAVRMATPGRPKMAILFPERTSCGRAGRLTRLRPTKSHEARRRCLRAERRRRVRGAINLRVSKPTIRYEGQARDAQGNDLNGVNFDARSCWFSFLADSTA